MDKQAYKIELPKKLKIHNVFHVLLLEQDITRKEQVDETTSRLKFENDGDGKEYEVKVIRNNAIYVKKSDSGYHVLGFYYLVSWKSYLEEEKTWKPTLTILHLCKLISIFHHDHPENSIATSPPIESASPMARPTAKPRAKASSTKQKQGRPAKDSSTSKRVKKIWTSSFLSRFWPCLNSRQKILIITWSRSAPLHLTVCFFDYSHFLIFTYLSVFPPRHWLRSFFY